MAVNHVSPHKFGDRKALGVFRIVAAIIMVALFCFLTVYEAIIAKNRYYLSMRWWVCLGTALFFALSLIPYKFYFNDMRPDSRTIKDGSHPFYDWKIITNLNCFMLQASIHLIVLQHLQEYDVEK